MKLSEKFDEVLTAMHKARSMFVKVKKDKQNTHLKNKYATLDSVLDAITPALTDNDLMLMQDMIESEAPNRIKVETTVIHVSGQWVKFYAELPIVKNDPQGVGSAFTYARRYAAAAAFGLSQADDDAQIAVKSAQDWKRDIDKCEDLESLQRVLKQAWSACDPASKQVVKEHYESRKAQIEIGSARGFSPAAPRQNLATTVDQPAAKAVESQPITDFESLTTGRKRPDKDQIMHVITGDIRKEPRVKAGANGTLYIVELSERYKDRDQQWQYTNYTFFFNAKSEGLNGWYQEAFQVGKVISVSCETLRIESREYEGKIYNTLQAGGFANLIFSQRGGQQQAPQQSQPRQQTQSQPRQNSEPPIDFDDDIPF